MITLDIIKNRIQDAIKQSSLSQTDIAKQLTVSQSCIAHYVKGDILPALDTFANLCVVLDVDPAYLLGIDK